MLHDTHHIEYYHSITMLIMVMMMKVVILIMDIIIIKDTFHLEVEMYCI
jgi:hypothetical protein